MPLCHKNPKVKKSTLIKSKEKGGLDMVDFALFDKALKVCWVKRRCSEGDQAWKLIPLRLLSRVGGTPLFQCNYDVTYLNLSADLPAFYKGVISHWQELNNAIPTTKKDVSHQIVWNNQFININKTSAFIRSWHHAGVCKLSSLLDESNTRFLSFNEFLRKFKVKCNFLQYHGCYS